MTPSGRGSWSEAPKSRRRSEAFAIISRRKRSPGAMRTPMNAEKLTTPRDYANLLTMIPYGRIGEMEEPRRAARQAAAESRMAADQVALATQLGLI